MQENKIVIEQENKEQEIEIERENREREIEVEGENIVLNIITDYQAIENKPRINDVELKSGNNTLDELGIQEKGDYATRTDISEFIKKDVNNLENYYDKQTADTMFLKEHQSLDEYAKTEDVAKEYATKENVNTKLEDYVTNQALEEKHYLTEHQDISNLATKDEVKLKVDKTDLENYTDTETLEKTYATKEEIPDIKSFITKDVDDLTNYYDKDTADEKITPKADKTYVDTNFVQKPEIADFIKKDVTGLENYYDKTTIDSKTENFITKTVNDLTNYYLKTETYNQTEIDQKISTVISGGFKKVDQLPEQGESKFIYLVPADKSFSQNIKNEFIWLDEEQAFEQIGSTQLDLEPYATIELLNQKLQECVTNASLEAKLHDYAKTSQIPDVSNYITDEEVDTKLLNKADKSEIPSLENYYTKDETYSNAEIDKKIEASGVDLSSYLKKDEASETYLEQTTAKSTYATKSEIPNTKDFITEEIVDTKLEDYYSKQDIDNKGYLTEHQDISNLATKDEIPDTKSFITKDTVDLTNYYDKDTVDNKLSDKQPTGNYALKSEIPTVGKLDTTSTTTLTAIAAESLSGTVKLHKVSKSGSYNDLLNKPTIPSTLDCVKLTGDQSVGGVKSFTSIPVLPTTNPTTDNQATRKNYVDTQIKSHSRDALLGTQLTSQDLDAYHGDSYLGYYYGGGGNTVQNKPSGVAHFGLEVVRVASGYYTQICFSENKEFRRTYQASAWTAWEEKGLQGKTGATGPAGPTGATGAAGSNGKDGTSVTITSTSVQYQASSSGTQIPTSTWQDTVPTVDKGKFLWTKTVVNYSGGKSTTSYSVGYAGTNGTNGTNGKDGAAGKNGTDGVSPTVATTAITGGTKVTITDKSGSHDFNVLNGKDGATGSTGPAGPKGDQGNKGDTGVGISNIDINELPEEPDVPAEHEIKIFTTDGKSYGFGVKDGKRGNTGPQGPTGPAGPAGHLVTNATTAQTASASEAFSGTITLHKVSKTGSYSDLLNKPTIPNVGHLSTANLVALGTSASESFSSEIKLHKIAKTGTYDDLIGKPTIPTASSLKTEIGALLYPVGSIFMSTSSTNPSNSSSLGFGTWELWGAGKVPVCVNSNDTDFSTVEKSGGSKTISYKPAGSVSVSGTVQGHTLTIDEMPSHNHGSDAEQFSTAFSPKNRINTGGTASGAQSPATKNTGGGKSHSHGFSGSGSFSGTSANLNVLQPYITCYMWKRTA